MSNELSNKPVSRATTSADVAQRAGVSRATVSYILNSTPGYKFSERTRLAVFRAAEELSYRPNAAARSLAAGSSVVVIVVPRLPQNDFTARVGERLTSRLAQRGMLSTLVHEPTDSANLIDIITVFRPRAAVFFSPPSQTVTGELEQAGVTIVTPLANPGSPSAIGMMQVEHLVRANRRTLAFAASEAGSEPTRARQQELIRACERAGLDPPLVSCIRLDGKDAADIVRLWHSYGVDAVCAYNDDVALAVLFGIRDAGLRCPEDIAVIGSDGTTAGAVAYPPLTTIAVDPGPAADWFVTHLLGELGLEDEHESGVAPADAILRLVVRESA